MNKRTEVRHLETGNVVQGNGGQHTEWEVVQCFRPFNEGVTYHVEFQNVETGERLHRYLPENREFNVLR